MFVIVAILRLSSVTVEAQSTDYSHLRGFKAVSVVVRPTRLDAASCGRSTSVIETAATKTLQDNGLAKPDAQTILNVQITTLQILNTGLCASLIYIQLTESSRPATPSYWADTAPATVTLELDALTALHSSPVSVHPDSIAATIRKSTEQIVTHIRLANQE